MVEFYAYVGVGPRTGTCSPALVSEELNAPGRVDRKGPRVFCLVRAEVIADPPIALAFHGSCDIYGELAAAAAMSGASCLACCSS